MKFSKLFLELFVLVFLSSILIGFGKIDTTLENKDNTPKVVNTYSTVINDAESFLLVANIKDFLGNSIDETAQSYLEFNIDTNEDQKEDIVIQAIANKGRIYFYGPISVNNLKNTEKNIEKEIGNVIVTPLDSEPITFLENEIYLYAGIKQIEMASFFDFVTSVFSNSNKTGMQKVVSIAIKLPKEVLGISNTTVTSWVTIKKK